MRYSIEPKMMAVLKKQVLSHGHAALRPYLAFHTHSSFAHCLRVLALECLEPSTLHSSSVLSLPSRLTTISSPAKHPRSPLSLCRHPYLHHPSASRLVTRHVPQLSTHKLEHRIVRLGRRKVFTRSTPNPPRSFSSHLGGGYPRYT